DAVETSSGLLLTFAIGAVVGPFFGSIVMEVMRPGGLFLYTAGFHLLLAAFAVYRMRRRATPPIEEKDRFVAVEPRLSAQVFELDPRAEPTGEADPEATGGPSEERQPVPSQTPAAAGS